MSDEENTETFNEYSETFNEYSEAISEWKPTASAEDATTIHLGEVERLIGDWNKAIKTFSDEMEEPKAKKVYETLTDAELEDGFAQSFDENITTLVETLTRTVGTINTALNNIALQDQNNGDDLDKIGGGSGSGFGFGFGSDPSDNSAITNTLIDNAREQLDAYKLISMSNLDGISDELTRLARTENKTLDELLSDSSYKDKIRSLLLNSQNIPDNLKELIKAGEFSISQNILKSIFDGKETEITGLDDNTVITMRTYLTNVAASNNTTLTALLENSSNSSALKSALNDFKKVSTYINSLSESEIAAAFTKIHDGDGIANVDSSVLSIIRTYVDTVAQNNNTSTEALIASGDIVSTIENLGRSSVFASSLSHYSDSAISAILNEKFG